MALEGFTSFVIEGERGKEIYDMIMDLRSKLKEGEEIALTTIGDNDYHVGLFDMGSHEPCVELVFSLTCKISLEGRSVPEEIEFHCSSYICEDDVTYLDNILHINTSWRHDSALLDYMEDIGMNNYPGYYYHYSSEHDIVGTTNDTEGKYCQLLVVDDPEYNFPR